MSQDATALMDTLEGFMLELVQRLPAFFPWVASLRPADRRTLALELLQAVHAGDMDQLAELLDDWQATAEALNNPGFLEAWRKPDNPEEEISWEQARGELNLSHDPEMGHRPRSCGFFCE
jgi:hypothetical protein